MSTADPVSKAPILACDVSAIPAELRPMHQANTAALIAQVQATSALPTGLRWQLPNDPDVLTTLLAFVTYERRCCPFFQFTLEIAPAPASLWLAITAVVDVTDFLVSEGFPAADGAQA